MKKIIMITLLSISSWVTNIWPNNRLISDSLRRYGINSHIIKTSEFKKARRSKKLKDKIKNEKHKKRIRLCRSMKTDGNS